MTTAGRNLQPLPDHEVCGDPGCPRREEHDRLAESEKDPCPRCGGDHDRIDRREPCPMVQPCEGCGKTILRSDGSLCEKCDDHYLDSVQGREAAFEQANDDYIGGVR